MGDDRLGEVGEGCLGKMG